MKINELIDELISYGLDKELIEKTDVNYVINNILDLLLLDSYEGIYEQWDGSRIEINRQLHEILEDILRYACSQSLIEDSITYKDIFDSSLMACLTPAPSVVNNTFNELYKESPVKATDYFYKLSCNNNYIRRDRIKKDVKWKAQTDYGELDITINLSKPEKDPKAIALAGIQTGFVYPRCQLCLENEGYKGRLNHPARGNHRVIRINVDNSEWGFQYSPYVYYNEHCIVFNTKHVPMKIDEAVFRKLLSIVKSFPHYFVGSNADLPIVGGSILAHEHFQGGNYEFAMARAPIDKEIVFEGFDDIKAGIVKWPMSVIRLKSKNAESMVSLATRILDKWRGYTDEEAFIYAKTEGVAHNTITPIARMRDSEYELDLVLRNNITTKEHPLGVYHPHQELHHIKKENIGLIEVMGLAVLPARLKEEFKKVEKALVSNQDVRMDKDLEKHADWVDMIRKKYADINEENVTQIVQDEVGIVFMKVLSCAGVYKDTNEGREAFLRFIESV